MTNMMRRSHAVAAVTLGLVTALCIQGAAHAQAPSASASPPSATPTQTGVAGVWIDDTGKGAVEIAPCGDRLCGHIVWLMEPNDASGKPLTDGYNPEAAKRRRPICGLQVIGDTKRITGNIWDSGWIYDPKEGKQYDVEIRLRSPERLAVTGYLGVKFLSETFVWTRAPAGIGRCATTAAAPTRGPSPQATAR